MKRDDDIAEAKAEVDRLEALANPDIGTAQWLEEGKPPESRPEDMLTIAKWQGMQEAKAKLPKAIRRLEGLTGEPYRRT